MKNKDHEHVNLCDNVNSDDKYLKQFVRIVLGSRMSSETGSGSTRNPEGLFAFEDI